MFVSMMATVRTSGTLIPVTVPMAVEEKAVNKVSELARLFISLLSFMGLGFTINGLAFTSLTLKKYQQIKPPGSHVVARALKSHLYSSVSNTRVWFHPSGGT